MLDYIRAMVDSYSEINDAAQVCGLKPQQLVRKAVRQFVREFVPGTVNPDELLQTEHGKLSPEEARALFKQLASYFARKGGQGISSATRKERGAAGAKARWGKKPKS